MSKKLDLARFVPEEETTHFFIPMGGPEKEIPQAVLDKM